MARQTTAQKTKVAQKKQCGSCGEVFSGTTCPNCEEKIDIYPINSDGLPMVDVANAIGATHSLPIKLQRSPEFDPDFELEEANRRQMKDVLQEAQIDKVRTAAAIQAAKRLRAEKELEATEKGFMPPREGDGVGEDQQQHGGMNGMSSAMFIQALGGWNPEAREGLFDRLKADPEFAFNFSRVLNPQPGMPGMPQMNQMGWMGGMMQQPVEREQPTSAADMLTAVIAAVATLKELSGGENNNSSMDRVLDKIDEMKKETESLKLQLVEAQNHKSDVTHEDIRRIVADAVATTTDGKIGLINGLKEIHTLRDELIDLGIAQEPSSGIDPAQSLDEKRFDHEVRMDELKEKREHELRIEAEKAEQAAAETKGAFINGLFSTAQQSPTTETEDGSADDMDPIDVARAPNTRPDAVIS